MEVSHELSVLQECLILNCLCPLVYKNTVVARSEKSFLASPILFSMTHCLPSPPAPQQHGNKMFLLLRFYLRVLWFFSKF